MADSKLEQLVTLLGKKTTGGKLNWEKTEEEGTFQTAFPGSSVRLSLQPSGKYQGSDAYLLQIFNEAGELIEEMTDEDLDGGTPGQFFTIMRDMHTNARRAVMGVDKALNSILEELSTD